MHRWTDPDNDAEVTMIIKSAHSSNEYAVGYGDGSVRIWNISGALKILLRGHASPICSMAWDPISFLLASGSRDGDIVVWDTTAESGKARLKGHRAAITKLVFLSPVLLVSSGKDSQIKAWDISIQHCFQTLVQEHPVGSFTILPDQALLVTGIFNWLFYFKDALIPIFAFSTLKEIFRSHPHHPFC